MSDQLQEPIETSRSLSNDSEAPSTSEEASVEVLSDCSAPADAVRPPKSAWGGCICAYFFSAEAVSANPELAASIRRREEREAADIQRRKDERAEKEQENVAAAQIRHRSANAER